MNTKITDTKPTQKESYQRRHPLIATFLQATPLISLLLFAIPLGGAITGGWPQ